MKKTVFFFCFVMVVCDLRWSHRIKRTAYLGKTGVKNVFTNNLQLGF